MNEKEYEEDHDCEIETEDSCKVCQERQESRDKCGLSECEQCRGTGLVKVDVYDPDSNTYQDTDTKKCECTINDND